MIKDMFGTLAHTRSY